MSVHPDTRTVIWLDTLELDGMHLVTETIKDLLRSQGQWIEVHVVGRAHEDYKKPVRAFVNSARILKLVPQGNPT